MHIVLDMAEGKKTYSNNTLIKRNILKLNTPRKLIKMFTTSIVYKTYTKIMEMAPAFDFDHYFALKDTFI